jgi:hypothetical protein
MTAQPRMSVEDLLREPPYSLPQAEKERVLLEELTRLNDHHRQHCPEYARLTDIVFPPNGAPLTLAGLPYLPVGLFKERLLSSIPPEKVFKVLQSSGTTGQVPSRITLDHETALLQTRALSRIMTYILGPERLPMLLIESPDLIRDRNQFNARGAGLLGMMNFGRHHCYALNSELALQIDDVRDFLQRFGHDRFLIFGFTFLAWSAFLQPIQSLGLDLSQGILIHSGGWKKLQEQAVTAEEFREAFRRATGLTCIYNFYGMVEQVGSIFLEGDDGYFYPPAFADVIIRDPVTLAELPVGEQGVVEVLSLLPRSYPGHALLTEDLGVVHAIDPAGSDRRGKAFSILGRIPRAELRGCSDVIAAQVT